MEIDPESHDHSEWIHVRILEAKIKGAQFYTTDFLLGQNFGTGKVPISKMSNEELNQLSKSLYYQLNERVSFVKPKETIVAQLLFDLGNIAFLLHHYSDALGDYEQAKIYGFDNEIIENRIKEVTLLRNHKPQTNKAVQSHTTISYFNVGFGIAAVLILITLIILIYRKGKKWKIMDVLGEVNS